MLLSNMDDMPKSPRDDFYIRYGNESRIHQFLSKYPDRITTWTEDINRSNNIANNIDELNGVFELFIR